MRPKQRSWLAPPRSRFAQAYPSPLESIDIGAGVVDSDYRGEIRVLFINNGSEPYHINCHDRIAQLIFEKFEPLTHLIGMTNQNETVEEEHEPDLERGEGGFGSTGV